MSARPNYERALQIIGGSAHQDKNFVAIDVAGDVDDAMAARVERQLRASPKASAVHLTVSSRGGDVGAMWRIVRAIERHSALRKTAYGHGIIASAAVPIFVTADVRRVAPGTEILLHAVAAEPGEPDGRWTASLYDQEAQSLRDLDARIARHIAARCGKPINVVMARLQDERCTPLIEALSLGLIHEVVGESAPMHRGWPELARQEMAASSRLMVGSGAYRYEPGYLLACKIGGIS